MTSIICLILSSGAIGCRSILSISFSMFCLLFLTKFSIRFHIAYVSRNHAVNNKNNKMKNRFEWNYSNESNHTIFRHANFIGCLSADKIKMPVRKYFCFNIPVYRNMAEEPSCRSPYHEEYIQTSVSGNSEGLCRSTYSFLSERR